MPQLKPLSITEYISVYRGSYNYQCAMCGLVIRKDEIKDKCIRCGRLIEGVKES